MVRNGQRERTKKMQRGRLILPVGRGGFAARMIRVPPSDGSYGSSEDVRKLTLVPSEDYRSGEEASEETTPENTPFDSVPENAAPLYGNGLGHWSRKRRASHPNAPWIGFGAEIDILISALGSLRGAIHPEARLDVCLAWGKAAVFQSRWDR